MLVLSRHVDEQIRIGDDIVITVVKLNGHEVKIGIDAPKNVPVHRQEVYEQIQCDKETRRDWSQPPTPDA